MDNTLHCKVFFRNELRRFPMNGIGFMDLQKIIQTLFGFEKEFTLQYRDNENDLVILSSNEDLACALSCIPGNILQVVVVDPTPPPMDVDQKTPPPFHPHWGHQFRFQGGHPPPFIHRHGHFGKDQSRRGPWIGQKKEILSRRLQDVESAIMEMSGLEEPLAPLLQRRLFGLQTKKRRLEIQLLKFDERNNSGRKSEKIYKKRVKHEKKFLKKIDKHGKLLEFPVFPPESSNSAEISTIHAKLLSLRPELEEIKIQLQASKAALKEAQQRGESTEQWVLEVSQLKEAKNAKKQQMVPLGLQLRDLHVSQRIH
jgi:hypothetical protein